MVLLEPTEEEVISTQLLKQLSETPYACCSHLQPLSSRPGNYVYRGILARPIHIPNGAKATSIIIKHSTDSVPKTFEELLLNSLANDSPSTNIATVKSPRLYMYDVEANIQILEDFPNTNGFRAMLFSIDSDKLLPSPSTTAIGHRLGLWLRSFHIWASSLEQAGLRAQMWQNDPMRKVKYNFTYDTVLKVLGNYPEILKGYEKTLENIQDVIAKEFEMPSTGEGDGYGLLHGDFWSGK